MLSRERLQFQKFNILLSVWFMSNVILLRFVVDMRHSYHCNAGLVRRPTIYK